jgi:Subtilase family.
MAFLSRLGVVGGRFDIIVDRGAAAGGDGECGSLGQPGAGRCACTQLELGVHRSGSTNRQGEPILVNVRSGLAFDGYALLLERFFAWLKRHYPNVIVVNSAGNNASSTDNHLPASLVADQLLVVGGHQRSGWPVNVENARFAVRRASSSFGPQVDIYAAACPGAPPSTMPRAGRGGGCGTSYAAALVTGVVAAMISINPDLEPKQVKAMLKQSARPLLMEDGGDATVLPNARLNMHQALQFAIRSRQRPVLAD